MRTLFEFTTKARAAIRQAFRPASTRTPSPSAHSPGCPAPQLHGHRVAVLPAAAGASITCVSALHGDERMFLNARGNDLAWNFSGSLGLSCGVWQQEEPHNLHQWEMRASWRQFQSARSSWLGHVCSGYFAWMTFSSAAFAENIGPFPT